jgi:hypothetical protein
VDALNHRVISFASELPDFGVVAQIKVAASQVRVGIREMEIASAICCRCERVIERWIQSQELLDQFVWVDVFCAVNVDTVDAVALEKCDVPFFKLSFIFARLPFSFPFFGSAPQTHEAIVIISENQLQL